jgi:dephospho-CoA kinase
MPLIYVTGIETAGKTTACSELKKRGYEAHDIDKGIAHYYDKETGKQSEWLGSVEDRTEEWHQKNDYSMDRVEVERFEKEAKDKPIFLCGTTQNDDTVLDLFDQVIYLYLDEVTLRQRMARRQPNEFAFAEHEKKAILSWHKTSEEAYRMRGAVMVDATKPINEVADSILEATIR